MSIFGQLSSKGRTGTDTFDCNFQEIRAGAGGPVCFFCTWRPLGPSAGTQDFFFLSAGICALVGGGKKTRKGKEKENK